MLNHFHLVKRPYPHPGLSDKFISVNIPNRRIPAVRTVIPVIAHDKVLVFPERDRLISSSRIRDRLFAVGLRKQLTVYIDVSAVININGFPGQSDNPFDVIGLLRIAEGKYDNVKTLRL